MKSRVEVRVHWGDELLDVRHVTAEEAQIIARTLDPELRCDARPVVVRESFGPAPMDRDPWIYVGATLGVAGLMLLAASFLPPQPASLTLERNALATRNVRAVILEELPAASDVTQSHWEGQAPIEHDEDPGRAGERTAPTRPRVRQAAGNRDDADHGERHVDVGVLAALHGLRGSWASQSPFAGAAGGADTYASLVGEHVGESFGFGGLSLSSTGRGTGRDGGIVPLEPTGHGGGGSGSVCGCGPMGRLGRGHGAATIAITAAEPELLERESRVPTIRSCGHGCVQTRGVLAKDVIRRVVRRHRAEVRHCYEQGLQVRPDLEGRVVTTFTITPSGEVLAPTVGASTVGHAPTETCIAAAVRRWTFPASDGTTNVTYPFILESL